MKGRKLNCIIVLNFFIMARKSSIHVVPRSNGWGVKSSGSSRASKVFRTKAQAFSAGRRSAIGRSTELFVHNRSGKIGYRNSYGNDSFPPRG